MSQQEDEAAIPGLIAQTAALLKELGAPAIQSLSPAEIVKEALEVAVDIEETEKSPKPPELRRAATLRRRTEMITRKRWNDTLAKFYRILRSQARLRWDDWNFPAKIVEIDDIVQGALAKAHAARDSFQGGTDGEYCNWLLTTLERYALDQLDFYFSAAKRNVAREVAMGEMSADSTSALQQIFADAKQPTASEWFRRREVPADVLFEIDCLSDTLRDVVVLFLRGHEPEEIAKELGIEVELAKRRLRDATTKIKKRLGDEPSEN